MQPRGVGAVTLPVAPEHARLALEWNAPQIWAALSADGERPAGRIGAPRCAWLLWRQELGSFFRSLTDSEAAALDAAREGWPFGELCGLLCEQVGEERAPPEAATLLRGWVAAGLIAAASLSAGTRPGAGALGRTIAASLSQDAPHGATDLQQRAADDRQHAADGRAAHRYRTVRAVPQAREPESRRLHQGPRRALPDRGGRARRAAQAGRHAHRGHRRQHRAGPGAGGGAEGLPAAAGDPRQDEPGEDLSPEGHGRGSGDDALGCQQGPSGVLPGRGRASGPRDPRAPSTSTSSATPPTRRRTRRPPRRRSGSRCSTRLDAVVCGVGHRRHARPGLHAFLRAHRARGATWCSPTRRAPVLASYANTGKLPEQHDAVAGRGHRRGLHAAGRRPLARGRRRYTIPDAEAFRTCRELLKKEGIIAGTSTGTLLAAALRYCREQTQPEAGRHLRLRQRQQVPLQGLQRLLDARPGLLRARAASGTCAT